MMFAKFDPDNIPDVIPCGPMKLGRDYAASVQKIDPFAAIAPYPGQFMVGDTVILVVQRYEAEKRQMYGKILSKW